MDRHGARRKARGTSTLEFIVVLPCLLLIIFGSVELSRMWMTMNLVTQAAREGARLAVVTAPFSSGPAIARINNVLAGGNLTAAAVAVSCAATTPPCEHDNVVTASVTVNFQTLLPLLLPMLAGPLPLQASAVMRYE